MQREDRNCSRKYGDESEREGLHRDSTDIENEKNMQGGRDIERELCREMTEILLEKNCDDREREKYAESERDKNWKRYVGKEE